jgi:chemotaxis protein MotB
MGKKKSADCPMMPGWLVTYGDLMSLLLTFFILLQSFSSIQESEFKKAIGSIMIALGINPISDTMIITPMLGKKGVGRAGAQGEADAETEELLDELQQEIEGMLKDSTIVENKEIGKNIKMEATKQGVHITISDSIIFGSGSAALKPDFQKVLIIIGKVVAPKMNTFDMVVEGHSDNIPISTAQYPSNWELSSSRALSVLKYMLEQNKLLPSKLTAVGYGEYRPISDNKTTEGRSKNRRVEIYLNKTPPKVEIYKGDQQNITNTPEVK